MPLCANAQVTLNQVDELIAQGYYNQALILCTQYMIDNTKDFDQGQKRVELINKHNAQFATMFDKLTSYMEKNPEDVKTHLDMISEIKKFEPHPDTNNAIALKLAEQNAEFKYNQKEFNRYMAEGKKALDKNQLKEAASIFSDGLVLYQEKFFNNKTDEGKQLYDEKYIAEAKTNLETVRKNINLMSESLRGLNAAVLNFEKTISTGTYQQSADALENLTQVYSSFAEERNEINSAGLAFKNIFENIKKEDSSVSDANFPSFAYHLVLGMEEDKESGVISAYDVAWEKTLSHLKELAIKRAQSEINRTTEYIDSKNFLNIDSTQNVKPYLNDSYNFSQLAIETEKLNSLRNPYYEYNYSTDEKYTTNFEYAKNLTLDTNTQLSQADKVSQIVLEAYHAQENINSFKGKAKQSSQAVKNLVDIATMLAVEETAEITSQKQFINTHEGIIEEIEKPYAEKLFETNINLSNKIQDAARVTRLSLWISLAQYVDAESADISQKFQAILEQAKQLKEDSDPLESIRIMNIALTALDEDMSVISEHQTILEEQKKYEPVKSALAGIPENEYGMVYLNSTNNISDTIASINDFRKSGNMLVTEAAEQVKQSEENKKQYNELIRDADKAIARGDFSKAEEKLEEARKKRDDSLKKQKSDDFMQTSTQKIMNTLQTRQDKIAEINIQKADKLMDEARNEYYASNFELAAKNVTQAKSLFFEASGDTRVDIEWLYSLVTNALKMQNEIILPTDWRYAPMSEYLNHANLEFERAQQLRKQNKIDLSNEALRLANENIQQVKLLYPSSREANLLQLKIDQFIDQEKFNLTFQQRYKNDVANLNVETKRKEALLDLETLYELNPNYKGLKETIENAKESLGINNKKKTVTKTNLAKINTLVNQANKIINSSSPSDAELNRAKNLINEALSLDYNNKATLSSLSKLTTIETRRKTGIMTTEDELTYSDAVTLNNNNKPLDAYELLLPLFERNKNNVKFNKLFTQLKSKLGIS